MEKEDSKKVPALKEEYQKKSNKEQIAKYRDDLLFMELFMKKEKMVLYNCTNTVYMTRALIDLGFTWAAVIFAYSGSLFSGSDIFFVLVMPILSFLVYKHNHFLDSFVEKIVYDPVNKKLEICKRSVFGDEKTQVIDATDLIFTSDEKLNKKRINYLNRKNFEQYSIIYTRAWKNFEFFSYLVKQNIRKELFLQNRDKN